VYSDTDPRSYQLSSYSYLILPLKVGGQFNEAKGKTLGAFAYYAMCQGQQQSASLGYSPMPINLVQASFEQISKIPGVVVQDINIQNCKNPTFSADGTNTLAKTAPPPQGCDKAGGVTQCPDGTGGLQKVPTAVKPANSGGGGSPATTVPPSGVVPGTTVPGGGVPVSTVPGDTVPVPTDATGSTIVVDPGVTVPGDTTPGVVDPGVVDPGTQCDPDLGCETAGGVIGGDVQVGPVTPTTLNLPTSQVTSFVLVLLVIALLLGAVLVPAYAWRWFSSRKADT
jgi:hypothetical protein